MSEIVQSALITVGGAVFIAILQAIVSTVKFLMNQYKKQVDDTVEAKNRELVAKDRESAAKDRQLERYQDNIATDISEFKDQLGNINHRLIVIEQGVNQMLRECRR